jgi:hypothetical protein
MIGEPSIKVTAVRCGGPLLDQGPDLILIISQCWLSPLSVPAVLP